jgi:hypothetical protein
MSMAMSMAPGPNPNRKHSNLGASGMSRWARCPGSYKLSLSVPRSRPSIHAATGTVAHDLIEAALQYPSMGELSKLMLGEVRQVDGYDVVIDHKLLAGVEIMERYVRDTAPSYDQFWTEQLVSLDSYFPTRFPPPEPLFGSLDVGMAAPSRGLLEIVDYKNGAGVWVGVEDNFQLLYYAAGALRLLPPNQSARIHRVRLTVVQPNTDPVHPIKHWDTTALDVELWVDQTLVPAVRAAQEPDAPLVSGAWCRFCPAAHTCPRLEQDAVEAAQRSFQPIEDGATYDGGLAGSLEIAERAEIWADAIREHAFEELSRGHDVPGWGLSPKRARRVWPVDETPIREILAANTNDPTPFLHSELRSPAQIETALKDRPEVWAALQPFAQSVSSGVKLSRTRPAQGDPFTPVPIDPQRSGEK